MADEQNPHLKFERFFTSGSFENPRGGGSKFEYVHRERRSHGASVKRQFNQAISEFEHRAIEENEELFNEDILVSTRTITSFPGIEHRVASKSKSYDKIRKDVCIGRPLEGRQPHTKTG